MKDKKERVIAGIVIIVLLYVLIFSASVKKSHQSEGLLINDVSRLNPIYVKEVIEMGGIEGLQQSLDRAREENLKVSIAGKRHSMGGQAFYDDALVLDMTPFNKVKSIDSQKKTLIVESGADWRTVIEALNEEKLAVKVMQAYNVFTVGGSVSVNVHESDPEYSPFVESVRSFTLLLANGSVVRVSRVENTELFRLVNGGYGLFGVILDVELDVVDDEVYAKKEYATTYTDYLVFFNELRETPEVQVIFARLSIAPDESLLKEMVVTTYQKTDIADEHYFDLVPPSKTGFKKFMIGLSRNFDWGKKLRWYLQKKYSDSYDPPLISRNNLMNNDIAYLNYDSPRNTDILQEYFVPVENLPQFIDGLREVVQERDANLLSATIRYVHKNEETMLSYSHQDVFGVVLYFNVGLSSKEQQKVEKWTQELIDLSLQNNGTYYLPYKLYGSEEQIRKAYPALDAFFEKKLQYDPQERFMSKFYGKYALHQENPQ